MDPRYWGSFALLLVCAALLAGISGCSTTRYLSEEEDAAMREKCEATGCVAIPVPLYRQIIEYIQRSRTI
jgi:hypothetical protein